MPTSLALPIADYPPPAWHAALSYMVFVAALIVEVAVVWKLLGFPSSYWKRNAVMMASSHPASLALFLTFIRLPFFENMPTQ